MGKKILVYNNCSDMVKVLSPFCAGEGIVIQEVVDEEELSAYLPEAHLVLLDILMDREHWAEGIQFLQKIRTGNKIPIIIVSDQRSEAIKIGALNAGADDFINTGTNPLVILARIKAQMRRYTQVTEVCDKPKQIYRVDGLEVDDIQRRVTVRDKEIPLTSTEYKILRFLMNEKGRLHSVDEIYKAVWGIQPIGVKNTIAVHIRHIREKIEENPAKPQYLKVAWGQGYMVG